MTEPAVANAEVVQNSFVLWLQSLSAGEMTALIIGTMFLVVVLLKFLGPLVLELLGEILGSLAD